MSLAAARGALVDGPFKASHLGFRIQVFGAPFRASFLFAMVFSGLRVGV